MKIVSIGLLLILTLSPVSGFPEDKAPCRHRDCVESESQKFIICDMVCRPPTPHMTDGCKCVGPDDKEPIVFEDHQTIAAPQTICPDKACPEGTRKGKDCQCYPSVVAPKFSVTASDSNDANKDTFPEIGKKTKEEQEREGKENERCAKTPEIC